MAVSDGVTSGLLIGLGVRWCRSVVCGAGVRGWALRRGPSRLSGAARGPPAPLAPPSLATHPTLHTPRPRDACTPCTLHRSRTRLLSSVSLHFLIVLILVYRFCSARFAHEKCLKIHVRVLILSPISHCFDIGVCIVNSVLGMNSFDSYQIRVSWECRETYFFSSFAVHFL